MTAPDFKTNPLLAIYVELSSVETATTAARLAITTALGRIRDLEDLIRPTIIDEAQK